LIEFHASRVLVLSFAAAIVAVAAALLGYAAADEQTRLSFIDAAFTATSAICVTGLIVKDTGSDFGFWGQAIILCALQMGGLGILTFSNLIILAQRGRLGLEQRVAMGETHGALPYVSPARLLRYIVLYTFALESLGAVALSLRFARDFPLGKAIWLGTFHAVSAFCNAGFSLFTTSLEAYRDDPVVNATVITLIILGGIGFIVVADLATWMTARRKSGKRRLSFHTRVTIGTTLVLLPAGAILVFALEMTGEAMAGSWLQHGMESVFMSVTARTAGFNTVPVGQLTNGALLVIILLMVVGGSPGSTAGGMKTTTLAALYALVSSRVRNRPKTELLDRSLPGEVTAKALFTACGFLLLIIGGVLALQVTELYGVPHGDRHSDFLAYLFEVVSALGTVGLSTGVTASLSSAGKCVIIACMFVGRLGPLVVANSLLGAQKRADYTYPEESLIVG
jgi:trk system potassium uptake protein TrkH